MQDRRFSEGSATFPAPSERDGHEEEIEIHGVNFNMEAPHDPNSLSRRGRVALDMIVFTKYYDMASPYLKKALFDNTPLGRGACSPRGARSRARPATIWSSRSPTPR